MRSFHCAVGCVVLFLSGPIQAQAMFDTVERNGGANVNGSIVYQDYDFSRSRFVNDGVGVFNPGSGPLSATATMTGLALSASNFSASGESSASFSSNFDGTTIQFQGTAAASMQAEALIGSLSGNNEGSASFGSTFNVALPMQAELRMVNSISTNSTYTFSILRQDGHVVWDQVSVALPGGGTTHDFATVLDFQPGYYTLATRLRAMAGIDQGWPSEPATVTAAFTLSPVPEPVSGALLLIGLWPVVRCARRASLNSRFVPASAR